MIWAKKIDAYKLLVENNKGRYPEDLDTEMRIILEEILKIQDGRE